MTSLRTYVSRVSLAMIGLSLTVLSAIAAEKWAPGEKELFDRCQELDKAGRYADAASVAQQWLSLCESIYPPDNAHTSASLSTLAGLYHHTGEYARAEQLFLRGLCICERVNGLEHRDTARCLNNLALLYLTMAEDGKAEPLLQRSLAIREKVCGPQHPDTARGLQSLATLYSGMGDYARAESLYQRSLSIYEKVRGPNHLETASVLNQLALTYLNAQEHARALPMFERALAIKVTLLGPEHSAVAKSYNSLGRLYKELGEFDKAEEVLLRSLAIKEKTDGTDQFGQSIILSNLASVYQQREEYSRARPLFERSLTIKEKAFGPDHPNTGMGLENLSLLLHLSGDEAGALSLANRAERVNRTNWEHVLAFTSERQREAASQTIAQFNLAGVLANGPLAARTLLWRKGSLLESLLEDRRAALAAASDPALARQLEEAEGLKIKLRQATLEGNNSKLGAPQIAALESTLEGLQKELARKVSVLGNARRSLNSSLEQVQAALTKGCVLVDFVRYAHALGRDQFESRYAAVIVPPDTNPVFVPLGPAQALEKLISRQRTLSGDDLKTGESATSRNASLEQACRDLHTALAAPLEKALPPGTQELILCPDGQLHFLAFSSLVDPGGRFWAEKFTLRHISTARDLLRRPAARASAPEVVLVGDPDFQDKAPRRLLADGTRAGKRDTQTQRTVFNLTQGRQNEEMQGLTFESLPGTGLEVAELQTRFQARGWKAKALIGAAAKESTLYDAVHSPAILHLSTHGFFLDELQMGPRKRDGSLSPSSDENPPNLRSALRDPMLRSGLALCGANTTLELWQGGKVPPLTEDGILTAADAASLKLGGTFLVTLSACETGLGEARSGEGVMGLKRGFAVAGAENLLMTLWHISDADTVALMTSFYDRVLAGEHPARALPAVQREFLVRLRSQHGIWHAINRAAPFVLVGATALPSR